MTAAEQNEFIACATDLFIIEHDMSDVDARRCAVRVLKFYENVDLYGGSATANAIGASVDDYRAVIAAIGW